MKLFEIKSQKLSNAAIEMLGYLVHDKGHVFDKAQGELSS